MLTPEQTSAALAEGWRVVDVYDQDRKRWFVQIAKSRSIFKDDLAAGAFVVSRARAGSKLHQQVLSQVLASHAAPTFKRKRS